MVAAIKTLSRVGSLERSETTPKGTLSQPVNAEVTISLDVKDLVDLTKEKAKIQKKIDACTRLIEDTKKKMAMPGYEKAKEEVKAKNQEKVESSEKELAELRKAMLVVEAAS